MKNPLLFAFIACLLCAFACKSKPDTVDVAPAAQQDSVAVIDTVGDSINLKATEDTIPPVDSDTCEYREVILSSPLVVLTDDVLVSFLKTKIVPLIKRTKRNPHGLSFIKIEEIGGISDFGRQEIVEALDYLPVEYYIEIYVSPSRLGTYADEIENEDYYVAVVDNQPILINKDISKKIARQTNDRYVWGKHRFYKHIFMDLLIVDGEVSWDFAMIDGKLRYVTIITDFGDLSSYGVDKKDYEWDMDPLISNEIKILERAKSEENIKTDSVACDTIPGELPAPIDL